MRSVHIGIRHDDDFVVTEFGYIRNRHEYLFQMQLSWPFNFRIAVNTVHSWPFPR